MTIKQIIKEWLGKNGYDGLTGEECGCQLSDLMPCNDPNIFLCEAGYKVPCPGEEYCEAGGGCEWHISTKKAGSDE